MPATLIQPRQCGPPRCWEACTFKKRATAIKIADAPRPCGAIRNRRFLLIVSYGSIGSRTSCQGGVPASVHLRAAPGFAAVVAGRGDVHGVPARPDRAVDPLGLR